MIIKNNNQFEIKTDLSEDAIDIDPGKVRQILLNLLSNAAKFTKDGQIRMSVKYDKHLLCVEVKDTGIGIPQEMQDQIFEAFRQVDMSTTRDYGGTGLGLGISQCYCQLMGGEITVKSRVGEGSTFTMRIPLPIEDTGDMGGGLAGDEAAGQPRTQAVRISSDSGLPSILIVDDDADFIDIQTRALRQLGYQVYTVNGVHDFLDEVRKIRPVAVILDIFLKSPDDGWALLAQLKNDDELKDMPVIVVSVSDERPRAMDMGAAEFLGKPVDRAELLVVLQQLRDLEASLEVEVPLPEGRLI